MVQPQKVIKVKYYIIINTMKQQSYEPEKCWVGEGQKICYKTRDEAEVAAKVAQYDHGAPELSVYKCEYGDHWHLSSSQH